MLLHQLENRVFVQVLYLLVNELEEFDFHFGHGILDCAILLEQSLTLHVLEQVQLQLEEPSGENCALRAL